MTRVGRGILISGIIIGLIGIRSLRFERSTRAEKPSRDYTIVVLGGSTAQGEPYAPRADLGQLTSLILGGTYNGKPIRIDNRAGPGRPSAAVVEDVRALPPVQARTAAAFLYIGNNEYLRFDRRHSPGAAERRLCDHPALTAAERVAVVDHYRVNLQTIVTTLQRAGYSVIAAAPGINLRDWEPNRSALADSSHATSVRAAMTAAERLVTRGAWAEARAAFATVLDIEPSFAAACKRYGDCAFQLGDRVAARRAYQRAADCDANPYRETSDLVATLRQVCSAHAVPVVDGQAALDAASPVGIAGCDVFWDNCHPTLGGYLALAQGFAAVLQPAGTTLRTITVAEAEQHLGIDSLVMRQVYAGRGQYCYRAATLTWDPVQRFHRAHAYLETADRLGPPDADILCSRAVLAALEDSVPRSLELWQRARALDAAMTTRRAQNKYVVQILARHGIEDLDKALR